VNVVVLCAGKKPLPHEQLWIQTYSQRIQNLTDFKLVRIKETPGQTVEQAISKTWKELERKIPKNSWRVLLSPDGKLFSTQELFDLFQKIKQSNYKTLTFLVGGAYGLPKEAKSSTNTSISLSNMTLPHRIALLILCEQIYRVLSIQAKNPYHHG